MDTKRFPHGISDSFVGHAEGHALADQKVRQIGGAHERIGRSGLQSPDESVLPQAFAYCEKIQLTLAFAFCENERDASDIPQAVKAILGKVSGC